MIPLRVAVVLVGGPKDGEVYHLVDPSRTGNLAVFPSRGPALMYAPAPDVAGERRYRFLGYAKDIAGGGRMVVIE